jgi:hypothetical protein
MKTYKEIGNNYHLKTKVYYEIGGTNYFTGKQEERGYYLSVSPVQIDNSENVRVEIYTSFSGYKKLLLPVKRKSENSYKKALEIAPEWQEILENKVIENLKK